ncbi:hypothetical protein [Streptomyces sp. CEV 2-1]|nr:hypothetical protein [Streptomyces sp. CEV 2-1]
MPLAVSVRPRWDSSSFSPSRTMMWTSTLPSESLRPSWLHRRL